LPLSQKDPSFCDQYGGIWGMRFDSGFYGEKNTRILTKLLFVEDKASFENYSDTT